MKNNVNYTSFKDARRWMSGLSLSLCLAATGLLLSKHLMAENLYIKNDTPRHTIQFSAMLARPASPAGRMPEHKIKSAAPGPLIIGQSMYVKSKDSGPITSLIRSQSDFAVDNKTDNADIDVVASFHLVEQNEMRQELTVSGAEIYMQETAHEVSIHDLVNQIDGHLQAITTSLTRLNRTLLDD